MQRDQTLISVTNILTTGDVASVSSYAAGEFSLATTVNALKNKALPTLANGMLRYNGTAWVFDNTAYAPIASPTFTGTVTLPVATGLLKATSGVVSVAGSGDLPGGPYLPLTAGSGKPLTGTLYGSNLNFTSTTDSPILITHNLSGAFTHPLQAFNSGMVAGNQYNFDFGQAASNYNAGNFGFKYVGAGSTSNYITLGLYGANDLLKITGAGVATFSGSVVTPALTVGALSGTLIGTSGAVSALSGTNIVLGNGTTIPQSTFATPSDLSGYLPLSGGTITGQINGTTATATPFIHITSTFGNLTNAAIRGTSTATGGAAIHGVATGINGAAIWGVSSNTGGEGGLFSGTGGANAVRAIATGGGKAGLFQGDVEVVGATKLASSLTGILKANEGVIGTAAASDIPGGPYLPLAGGNVTGNLGVINGVFQANTTYTGQGCLYGDVVSSKSATNYSLLWLNDGTATAINGSSATYMNVGGNAKVIAFSTGVTLYDTLTLNGYQTAGFVKTNSSGVVSIDTNSYLPLAGGTMNNGASITFSATGDVRFTAYGLSGMFNGNGDNAAYSAYNLKIKSWWGIGFESYDGVTRTVLDTRTGNFSTLGNIGCVGYVAWGGGILRDHYVDPNYFAIYGSTVGSYGNNYSLAASKNGQVSWLGGSVSSGFAVDGIPIATATSSGLAVTGLMSATNQQNSTLTIGSTYNITTLSPHNLRISGNTTITIPAASSTYAGMSWHVSSVYSTTPGTYYTLDVTGSYFKNNQTINPGSSHPYWQYGSSLGSPYLAASSGITGLFAFARIYCNGTAWFVELS